MNVNLLNAQAFQPGTASACCRQPDSCCANARCCAPTTGSCCCSGKLTPDDSPLSLANKARYYAKRLLIVTCLVFVYSVIALVILPSTYDGPSWWWGNNEDYNFGDGDGGGEAGSRGDVLYDSSSNSFTYEGPHTLPNNWVGQFYNNVYAWGWPAWLFTTLQTFLGLIGASIIFHQFRAVALHDRFPRCCGCGSTSPADAAGRVTPSLTVVPVLSVMNALYILIVVSIYFADRQGSQANVPCIDDYGEDYYGGGDGSGEPAIGTCSGPYSLNAIEDLYYSKHGDGDGDGGGTQISKILPPNFCGSDTPLHNDYDSGCYSYAFDTPYSTTFSAWVNPEESSSSVSEDQCNENAKAACEKAGKLSECGKYKWCSIDYYGSCTFRESISWTCEHSPMPDNLPTIGSDGGYFVLYFVYFLFHAFFVSYYSVKLVCTCNRLRRALLGHAGGKGRVSVMEAEQSWERWGNAAPPPDAQQQHVMEAAQPSSYGTVPVAAPWKRNNRTPPRGRNRYDPCGGGGGGGGNQTPPPPVHPPPRMPAGAADTFPQLAERLATLCELQTAGIISRNEYESQRRKAIADEINGRTYVLEEEVAQA